jgi:hypothetical protein
MATNVTRTLTDEATDALAAIADAELELARMRQHIERSAGEHETEGFIYQALNSGDIAEARIGDALKHTRAMRRAKLSLDA